MSDPLPHPRDHPKVAALLEKLELVFGLKTPPPPPERALDASALATLVRQHELSLGPIDEGQRLDLRGTVARGLTFPECSLHGALLQDAILHRSDLSRVRDLLPEALSGADLTNCRLPDTLDYAPILAFLDRLSANAGKLFLGLLVSVAAVLLTLFSLLDTALLSNSGVAVLPLVNVSIPVRLFFSAAPVILLLQYLTLHFYLQRLWSALASLPALFPDGTPLERRVHPWLMSDLVREGFPLLALRRTPIDALGELAFRLLTYAVPPLALGAIWLRLLPRHDWPLTFLVTIAFVLALLATGALRRAARDTLRRAAPETVATFAWRPVARQGLAWSAGLLFVAWGALVGAPTLSESDMAYIAHARGLAKPEASPKDAAAAFRSNGHRWPLIGDSINIYEQATGAWPPIYSYWQSFAPRLLGALRIDTFANLTERDVSVRPDGWVDPGEEGFAAPPPPDVTETADQRAAREAVERANERIRLRLKLVPGAALRGADLSFAHAEKAFLINADLREIVAPGANFAGADLRRSDLTGATLCYANLAGGRLQGAQLSGVRLQAAHLSGAKLQETDLGDARLDEADLGDARLQGAYITRASLRGAQLVNADLENAYLGKANLHGAYLFNARLRGAQLPSAVLDDADLTEATLVRADLTRASLKGADLSRANLEKAKLRLARLTEVDLTGAQLTGADITGADFDGASYFKGPADDPRNTRWPGGAPPSGYLPVQLQGNAQEGIVYRLKRMSTP